MARFLFARTLPLLFSFAIVATACGDESASIATGQSQQLNGLSDPLPFGLVRCDKDYSALPADPAYYRDSPVYVGNNQPVEELRGWAEDKPGYEDIWVDREHNGWVSIGFTEDAPERQAELETTFPDYGVVAVALEHSLADLREVEEKVFAASVGRDDFWGAGHQLSSGVVRVSVDVLDEETLASFAEFADSPVCFDGIEAVDAVLDGPQPTEGDGWRLLASERTGEPYRTGVASEVEQYDALWTLSGVTADRPEVNFEAEIVIWFGAVYGSGCEIRMDDVVFDGERSVIHGDFVTPGNPGSCNADANGESYLVAVERDRLPVGPFSVQLDADDPPGGAPEERTLVDADLSVPSAVALDAAIGEDPDLFNQSDLGYVVSAGGVMEPGFPARYLLDLSCNFSIVGSFNGVMWQSIDPEINTAIDPAWRDAADENGVLVTDVMLVEEPPSLSLSANGFAIDYLPAPSDAESDCEYMRRRRSNELDGRRD